MVHGYVEEDQPTGTVLLIQPDDDFCATARRALSGICRVTVAASRAPAEAERAGPPPYLALLRVSGPPPQWYAECMVWKRALGDDRGTMLLTAPDLTLQIRLLAAAAKVNVLRQSASVDELAARVSLEFQLLAARAELIEAKARLAGPSRPMAPVPEPARSVPPAAATRLTGLLDNLAGLRDPTLMGRQHRIQAYTRALACELRDPSAYAAQIDADFLEDLWLACHLHDLGKVGVPDSVLFKPGALVLEERAQVNLHAEIGANLLEHVYRLAPSNRYLAVAAQIARSHHERWDGTGYPSGLGGTEIPLAARIVALADTFDAITSERPYRPARTPEAACTLIDLESGRQFDPLVVQAFLRRFDEFVAIYRRGGPDANAPEIENVSRAAASPRANADSSAPRPDETESGREVPYARV